MLSPDWWVRGALTRIGETFDKLTGRNWKPSSSLATSELIVRLKKLLDAEVRDSGEKGRFVPHNIKLKMQWDKFSTDGTDELKKLENELLAAAVDHINDNRYHTYAPLKFEVKRDYFTDGVKLLASFDERDAEEREAELEVTMPQTKNLQHLIPPKEEIAAESENFAAEFTTGEKQKTVELKFTKGKRLSVGRTRENDLILDDASVSKIHATLALDAENNLLVADTGSTNGTFIGDERIAYGRAFVAHENARVKFGSVEVFFRRVPKQTEFVTQTDAPAGDFYKAGEDFAARDEFQNAQKLVGINPKND